MNILIKGMDMPKGEFILEVITHYEGGEKKDIKFVHKEDIIEIPTPHGRLIDGDKLIGEFIEWQYTEAPDHLNTKEGKMVTDHERQYEIYLALGEAVIDIANAPTILEAEE